MHIPRYSRSRKRTSQRALVERSMEIYFPMNSLINTSIHKESLRVLIDLQKSMERQAVSMRMGRKT
jgi:hypothetical protein